MAGEVDVVAAPTRNAKPRMVSYEDECASFRLEVPDRFNPVIDIVERWASEQPDDVALLSLDELGRVVASQTASELAAESRRAARALLALGVSKGNRVFVMLPRVPAWYSAMLGAARIGAIAIPAPNQLTSRDITYRITSADVVAAITDKAGAEKIDLIEEPPPSFRYRIRWSPNGTGKSEWVDLNTLMDEADDGETSSPLSSSIQLSSRRPWLDAMIQNGRRSFACSSSSPPATSPPTS